METKTKLFRTYKWYRPLSTILENGKQVILNNIVIYDKKGIIFETRSGYFNNDIEIEIKDNIVLKRKEDFTKKINFVISNGKTWDNKPTYNLYIHKNNVNVKFIGFSKNIDIIMKNFEINGGKASIVYKYLADNKNQYYKKFEEEFKNISNKMYEFPFDIQEIKTIFDNLTEINKLAIKEEQAIKNFDLTQLKEEEQKTNKRLNEED
jgi:hypothetical protein